MVLLELVGEVFEVRTHVDHDLTTVSRVDRRLGLIKNLGRHKELEASLLYPGPLSSTWVVAMRMRACRRRVVGVSSSCPSSARAAPRLG
jgi:hypothetical protein